MHAAQNDKVVVESVKPRNKHLHDVLSGRRGGRFQDKRKSRSRNKQEFRRSFGEIQ